jgi:hypothetical protein
MFKMMLIILSCLSIVSCGDNDNNSPSRDGSLINKDLSVDRSTFADAMNAKDITGSDLNCSFQARCFLFDSGIESNCFDESNPNPCCNMPVHPVLTYACNNQTNQCLTFMNDCIPAGWSKISTDASDL